MRRRRDASCATLSDAPMLRCYGLSGELACVVEAPTPAHAGGRGVLDHLRSLLHVRLGLPRYATRVLVGNSAIDHTFSWEDFAAAFAASTTLDLHFVVSPYVPGRQHALFTAITRKNPPAVEALLEEPVDPCMDISTGWWLGIVSPLELAAAVGATQVAKVLLRGQADVNQRSTHGTPLTRACEESMPSTAAFLLRARADPNAQDSTGDSLLHLAVIGRSSQLLRLLLSYKARVGMRSTSTGRTPLQEAVHEMNSAAVFHLLKAGAAACEPIGRRTALHYAAQGGHLAIATALVAWGASRSARDERGRQPRHVLRRLRSFRRRMAFTALLQPGRRTRCRGR